jgi:transcriptional regulator with XRE-family HTH domain
MMCHMHPDDARLAELVRLIRRELGITQVQLASTANVPLNDVKAIEGGRAGAVRLHRLRLLLEAEGGRGRLVPWWNGASADRLLDGRHAALVERVVALLKTRGWEVHVEVSFAEWGERGSIDVLALNRHLRVALVIEVKTAIGSLEETNRVLDAKFRLAPEVIAKRFGWRPRTVARVLVLPGSSTNRRVVAEHAATMDATYPARSREVRAWLRRPDSALSGIWFVSDGQHSSNVRR